MPRTTNVVVEAVEPWPAEGTELYREPWLKWPSERPHEYYAFCAYRDSPPFKRTVALAYRYWRGGEDAPRASGRQKTAPKHWQVLAKRFLWERRAEAYDTHNERSHLAKMDEAVLTAYQEMGERHAREAMALQAKALERLRMLNPADMPADTVLRYIVQAATLERLARGASLRDLAQAQREREQSGAVITYVDDWRGDQKRIGAAKPLPEKGESDGGATIVRQGGREPTGEERSWWEDRLNRPIGDDPWKSGQGEVPLPEPPHGPDHGPGGAA